MKRIALCAPAARRPATSRAVGRSSPSSTQRDTSPIRSASSPVSGSQVSRWYFAFAMPHSSGQHSAAWSPAATPRRVCPSMIRAERAAMDTSASSATTRPAPTAGPWMAETTGFEQSTTPQTRSRASRSTRVRAAQEEITSSMSSKEPPAENARPAPDTSTTRTSGSVSTTRHSPARSRWAP